MEHSSVYNSAKALEKEGFDVVYLKPDENGQVTLEQIEKAVDEETILVSMMLVNNEVGTVFPVEKIKKIIS